MSSRQKLIPYVHNFLNERGEPVNETWKQYFIDVRSGVIYFEGKIGGRRIKFSTKEKYPSGIKAKRYANAELSRRLGKKQNQVRTLIKEELALYLKVKDSENLSYATVMSYRRGVRQIEKFWGNMLPSEINRDTLTEWYAWWKIKNPDIQMEAAIKWLRNFCVYLSEKVINGMPMLPAVPKISDPNRNRIMIARANKKERIISKDEFKIILDTAENPIHQLIVLFMYTMATRIDETLKLKFGETIFLDEKIPIYKWFLGQNKADLVGKHALHLELIPRLKALYEIRKAEGTTMLFPQKLNNQQGLSEQQIEWAAWRKRANLGWLWTPHTFRHTCLTTLFNDPKNPQMIVCKQYRVSAQTAMGTYVKTMEETMLLLRDAIQVEK